MTHRRHARLASALLVSLLFASLTLGAAQTSYDSPALGFRVTIPAGWSIADEDIDDQEVMLFVVNPSGDAGLIVGAGPLEGSDREAYARGGIAAMVEPGFALVASLQNARTVDVFAATVGGREAAGFSYQADGISGRFVMVVSGDRIFALGSFAEPSGEASAEAALQSVLDSFTLTAAGTPAQGTDPFVGVFRGDGLTLTIDRAPDGSYVGTVAQGSNAFPLTATAGPVGLQGRFTSGADAFAFELTSAGDTLVFTTGGTRYTLGR